MPGGGQGPSAREDRPPRILAPHQLSRYRNGEDGDADDVGDAARIHEHESARKEKEAFQDVRLTEEPALGAGGYRGHADEARDDHLDDMEGRHVDEEHGRA